MATPRKNFPGEQDHPGRHDPYLEPSLTFRIFLKRAEIIARESAEGKDWGLYIGINPQTGACERLYARTGPRAAPYSHIFPLSKRTTVQWLCRKYHKACEQLLPDDAVEDQD